MCPRRRVLCTVALVALACSPACRRALGDERRLGGGPPRRVVALTCNATDIFACLGELDRVVAVEEDCPAPGTEGKVRIRNDDHVGKAKALNVEAILALHPDLVIAKPALREVLGPLGVPVLWPPVRMDMRTMPQFVRQIAATLGVGARGEDVLRAMAAKQERLRRRTAGLPRVRVYYESTGLGRSIGRRSILHEMIELAGGANLGAAADKPGIVLTNEAILAADPEVIVLSPFADPTDEVVARPGWRRSSAVRHGRVHRIPLDRRYVLLATPRCVDGCEEFLLPWLHPELFPAETGR
ncbi:MAG: ABC transporter substrate-binding protein [Planctomycetota bacterium]